MPLELRKWQPTSLGFLVAESVPWIPPWFSSYFLIFNNDETIFQKLRIYQFNSTTKTINPIMPILSKNSELFRHLSYFSILGWRNSTLPCMLGNCWKLQETGRIHHRQSICPETDSFSLFISSAWKTRIMLTKILYFNKNLYFKIK